MIYKFTGFASALQTILLLCEKVGLDISTTVTDVQKHLGRRSAAVAQNTILSADVMAGSDDPEVKKEALLSKDNKLKYELASRQNSASTAMFAELCRTHDANVGALKEQLQKSEKIAYGLHARLIYSPIVARRR